MINDFKSTNSFAFWKGYIPTGFNHALDKVEQALDRVEIIYSSSSIQRNVIPTSLII